MSLYTWDFSTLGFGYPRGGDPGTNPSRIPRDDCIPILLKLTRVESVLLTTEETQLHSENVVQERARPRPKKLLKVTRNPDTF